ncbi:hypothetical protein [Pseudorhodoferax sp. Leaf274]|uniref:hypothetical protein n=1 Tax=Pseudorhodoferax sp. Leaf274 TaxID=1736318 RepID=UPI000702BB1D|nr:hypothetical protein [Pseudorhodoferax sp. Leaf274]KQP36144.1 hypothetical protein ASF44_16380 [Pseudorhodoferax sp. Leaf274]
MAGPFDYSIQSGNPFQAALQGFQIGNTIQSNQLDQQAQQVKIQQQQAALQAQQQQQARVQALTQKGSAATADDWMGVLLGDPKNADSMAKVWSMRNDEQQQSHASNLLQWGAAIKSGRPDLAAQQMKDRADLVEKSGDAREAQALRANAAALEQNPQLGLAVIQAQLSANPRGKDAAETLAKFGSEQRSAELHPAAMEKATADAKTATTGAKFAESKAVLDLKMGEEQIKKWAADTEIAKMNSRIAAMNAATSRANSDIQRQELSLKLQDAISKRDDKLREKVSTAEAGATNIDNMLNTIQRIQQNPRLNSVIGSIEGRLPDMGSDQSADAIALIETLGSQAFLAQIPNIKGMGALSNAEGEKLQSALQNLSRKQSETQFRANLNEASRLLMKGRENIAKSTGVDIGKPDTPAAPGARPPLSSFQR